MNPNPTHKTNYHNLNIISLNINSLINISRRVELNNFIGEKNPDIILLNETKLNEKHIVKFEGYNMIRRDRSRGSRGGGTAIIIRDNIKYSKFHNSKIDSLPLLETCIIKINVPSNSTMFIIAAYYPAGNNNDTFKTELNTVFETLNLQNSSNFYILAGDLNSKHINWGNQYNNPKGNALKDWLTSHKIEFKCNIYASTTPSYERSKSFLDICLADHRLNIQKENNSVNCLKCIDYDSDHHALQIVVSLKDGADTYHMLENQIEKSLDYKNTNWKNSKVS